MHTVIAGAGQAGLQTAASLRELGFPGRISLVGDEDVVPYQRPPLSKAYLTGPLGVEQVALRAPSYFVAREIDLVLGERVIALDRTTSCAELGSGRRLHYDRLVLALGARPRRLPVPGAHLGGVLELRTLAHADEVRRHLAPAGRDVVVVGGGFVGMEVAAAARERGHAVTVVEAAHRPMVRALTVATSDHIAAEHRRQGTTMLFGRTVRALLGDVNGRVTGVELDNGGLLPADVVVVGVGVVPDVSLAAAAGLAVGDGIEVDSRLRTSDPSVYAVGDCALFPSTHVGGPARLESVQNAVDQARFVAAHICGVQDAPYGDLPWFWSQQYAVNLQIAGIATGHDLTVIVGDPGSGRFSVLCFAGDVLRAVESVNRPVDHIAARRLLAAGADLTPAEAARPGFALMDHARRATDTGSRHDQRVR